MAAHFSVHIRSLVVERGACAPVYITCMSYRGVQQCRLLCACVCEHAHAQPCYSVVGFYDDYADIEHVAAHGCQSPIYCNDIQVNVGAC